MADSAGKMFWVGTGELAITLLGVILVGWTLYHTRRAANAAWGALDLERLNRLPDLRTSIRGGELSRLEEILLRHPIPIGVANVGETQAIFISYCLAATVEPLPAKPHYPASDILAGSMDTVIEPRTSLTYPMKARLAQDDVRAVIEGRKKLWIYGFFRYREKLFQEAYTQRFGALLKIHDADYRRMAMLPENHPPGFYFSFEAVPDAYNRRVKESR